ncbi:MAG: hypothetical protein ACREBR_04795 [bacterium]
MKKQPWWKKDYIKGRKCATNKCKRKVTVYDGDFWCTIDKRRIDKLRKERI